MDHATVEDWVRRYEELWRTPGTDRLGVRVSVDYATGKRWRDLWVITLDGEGRCTAFEEWPFAPRRPDGQ